MHHSMLRNAQQEYMCDILLADWEEIHHEMPREAWDDDPEVAEPQSVRNVNAGIIPSGSSVIGS